MLIYCGFPFFIATHFDFFAQNKMVPYKMIPWCCACELEQIINSNILYDNARLQVMKKDFLWYLRLPHVGILFQDISSCDLDMISHMFFHTKMALINNHKKISLWDFAEQKGHGISIVVFDTPCKLAGENIPNSYCLCKKNHLRSKFCEHQCFCIDNNNGCCYKNHEAQIMRRKNSWVSFLQSHHGTFTRSIIQQIAPLVQVIFIPVMNECGYASKKELLEGLQKAYALKVDIVHLGLAIVDTKIDKCDELIRAMLKKFSYVTVATGNRVGISSTLSDLFYSVGAFQNKIEESRPYEICSWSQGKPNFVFPRRSSYC